MNSNWLFKPLILLLLIPLSVNGLEYPNRYNSMAETLFDMMDAFSSAYQRRLHERDRDSYGYPPVILGYGGGPYPRGPYPYPRTPAYSPQRFILNGSWQGASGEILVIRNDLFRIYLDRENFREGRLAQVQPQIIVMQDLENGQVRPYQFAESDGRLILHDPAGNILLYRRMGW